MLRRGLLLSILVGASLGSTPCFAQGAAAPDARALYKDATADFALGEFARAAEKYQEAYRLKPDPALLYNAAQAFRLAGNYERALVLYKNYLIFYPDGARVKEVRVQIAKLKETLASMEHAKTAPPVTTAELPGAGSPTSEPEPSRASSSSPVAQSTAAPPAPNQVALHANPPAADRNNALLVGATSTATDSPRPFYSRWWFWTAVGVVVVGGSVAAIALTSSKGGSWSTGADFGPGVR